MLHRHYQNTKTALDNRIYQKQKLQDLPEGYISVNNMLILDKEGYTHDLRHLTEEPDEVKVSSPVLKTSRVR